MPALSKNTTIAIASGIVVLGVVVYFVWMRPNTDPNVSIESGPTSVAQATFLSLAAQLEPVAFDASILSDSRFQALVDLKTVIVPETEGRTDPFAPLAGVAR